LVKRWREREREREDLGGKEKSIGELFNPSIDRD